MDKRDFIIEYVIAVARRAAVDPHYTVKQADDLWDEIVKHSERPKPKFKNVRPEKPKVDWNKACGPVESVDKEYPLYSCPECWHMLLTKYDKLTGKNRWYCTNCGYGSVKEDSHGH